MKSPDNNVHKTAVINSHVLEFMRNRRSVPAKLMAGPGPDEAQLELILEISCRSPDHGKLCPWRLIRYDRDKCISLGKKLIARAHERARHEDRILSPEEIDIERNRFLNAPVVIGVISCAKDHPKIPQWEQILSSGAVAMNMLIGANASGYDAQWLTQWYAYDDAMRQELGLREGERVSGFIHIGTRLNEKTERSRPALAQVYSVIGK